MDEFDEREIRAHLLDDHARFELHLEELLAAVKENDLEYVAAAWTRFESEARAHLELEERLLIPALARAEPLNAEEIFRQHAQIRGRLSELGLLVTRRAVDVPDARQFVGELQAHARYEDAVLYRWVEGHVAAADRATVRTLIGGAIRRAHLYDVVP